MWHATGRYARRRGIRTAFALVLVGMLAYVGCAQAQVRGIESPGKHTVGSKLADVRGYRASANCLIEGDNADCTFTDPNGVEYVVLEDSVIALTVREKTARPPVRLPFGLKFGEGVDTAVRKLAAGRSTWIIGQDPANANAMVVSSREKYSGTNGWDFIVEIRFEQGRLVSVSYNSGTI